MKLLEYSTVELSRPPCGASSECSLPQLLLVVVDALRLRDGVAGGGGEQRGLVHARAGRVRGGARLEHGQGVGQRHVAIAVEHVGDT